MSNICIGAGLISLDVLIHDGARLPTSYYVGGTCGNVMMILSYFGWDTYPIARLDGTKDTFRLLKDMKQHGVHTDYITTDNGKTPVIVQRNFINKDGIPTHKFESRNGKGHFYLDFTPLTLLQAKTVLERIDFTPKVFFCDRVSPAILKLATVFKERGSIVFFEPSSRGIIKQFDRCVEVADIIKFSEQRISDIKLFEELKDKLIIQTQGERGLIYRFNSEWHHLDAVVNENVVDTSGAGDWTASALIDTLFKNKENFDLSEIDKALQKAQAIGAKSCSFEGARGIMQNEAQWNIIEL